MHDIKGRAQHKRRILRAVWANPNARFACIFGCAAIACAAMTRVDTPGSSQRTEPSGVTLATDTFATALGPLQVTPIHHASLLLRVADKAIYIDPTQDGRYDGLPPASHVFITDIHSDHLDPRQIERIRGTQTVVIGPQVLAERITGIQVVRNGETRQFDGFSVEAIPMYNLKRGPAPDKLFHDKGRGNGYLFVFGNVQVYVSGDTECTEELRALKDIDLAFLCMNLPYTMPPAEAADCVRSFRPKVVYPYHYRGSDPGELRALLQHEHGIEVRIRDWY